MATSLRFSPGCQYFQARSSNGDIGEDLPMYRLTETLENGGIFVGDSFGDRSWIDASGPRDCSLECACHDLATLPEESSFAFTVVKTTDSLQVRFHSVNLRCEALDTIISANSPINEPIGDGSGALNGFVLLKCRPYLLERLYKLRKDRIERCRENKTWARVAEQSSCRLISEMSLLVHGLLNDVEVFQSFGLLTLHKQERMDKKQWRTFESVRYASQFGNLLQFGPLCGPSEGSHHHTSVGNQSWDPNPNVDTSLPCYNGETLDNLSSGPADEGYVDKSFEYNQCAHDSDNLDVETYYSGAGDFSSFSSYNLPDLTPEQIGSLMDTFIDYDSEALSMAAGTGKEKAVRELLRKGVDPNSTNLPSYCGSALYEAVLGGHESIVRLLIEHGASVAGTTVPGWTTRTYSPVLAAITKHSKRIFQYLIEKCPTAVLESSTLLQNCTAADRWIVAKQLLDCGVGIDAVKEQALEIQNPDARLLAVILAAGNDPDRLEENLQFDKEIIAEAKKYLASNNRLIHAVEQGSKNDIRKAISAGGDPSWALPSAFRAGNLKLARHLLSSGADPRFLSIKDDLCNEIGTDRVSGLLVQAVRLNDTQLVEVLLEQGADMNSIDPETRESVLVEAIRAGSYATVEYLLTRGASVNAMDQQKTNPLIEAMKRRNSGIVSLLLRHGASYDDGNATPTNLADQSTVGLDTEFIKLSSIGRTTQAFQPDQDPIGIDKRLLDDDAGRYTGQERLARLSHMRNNLIELCVRSGDPRETTFGTPEEGLMEAIRAGDVVTVQSVLQTASQGIETSGTVRPQVLNLDHLHDRSTCLMEAVRHGNLRIAKLLLQYGADANVMSSSETALSIAAKLGVESVLRLLFQYGADLPVAVLLLRLDCQKTVGHGAINRLTTMAKRYQEDLALQSAKVRKEVRDLQYAFLREHSKMKSVASSVSGRNSPFIESLHLKISPNLSQRWAYSLEMKSRKAWVIAKETLRRLCQGALPGGLNETLLFLALAKSMSSILDSSDDRDSIAEFKEDIARWQVLFNTEGGGQLAFANAVNAIWQVDLSLATPSMLPSAEDLEHFQRTAVNLMRLAANSDRDHPISHEGLLSTQARYRQSQAEIPVQPTNSICSNQVDCSDLSNEETTKDILADGIPEDFYLTLQESPALDPILDDMIYRRSARVLVILMAVMGDFFPDGKPSEKDETWDILRKVQKSSIEFIVAGVFASISENGEREGGGSSRSGTNAAHDKVQDAIDSGYITSFAKLQAFFVEDIENQFKGLGNTLAKACAQRKYLNNMQHAYSILRAYLGLRVTNICTNSPTPYRSSPASSENSPSKRPAPSLGMVDQAAKRAKLSPRRERSLDYSISPSNEGRSDSSSCELKKSPSTGKKTFCDECGRDYKTTSNYGKHRADCHDKKRYACSYDCGKDFLRNETRLRHEKKLHQGLMATKPQLPGYPTHYDDI
ncbi:putative C2H2-type domain-containing protein [Seiridium cardinale]